MKKAFLPLLLLGSASLGIANIAPTVIIQSAEMRPGTTLMDVVYRVNDPEDATVKTRALAFVDGVRSFAKVIRPVTFAEGTAANLGDAIPANVNHTLTWDVAADWDVDLGQVKFEVLAMDGRGLLSFDWISIPEAGSNPDVSISKNTPEEQQKLDALFWLYAGGDSNLALSQGTLTGSSASGVFSGLKLAVGANTQTYSAPFLFKKMNVAVADPVEVATATAARVGQQGGWLASNRSYDGITPLIGWGNHSLVNTLPEGLTNVSALSASRRGTHCLALRTNGTVFAWGSSGNGATSVPSDLANVEAIAAGYYFSLAAKSDGDVVAWGFNSSGQTTVPEGLTNVVSVKAGLYFSLALKGDGTVNGWGQNNSGQSTPPAGLSNVTAIAAGDYFSLALKSDGTIVQWGRNSGTSMPSGLSGVTAIAAGNTHSLALKTNGTVVGWGQNGNGQINIPSDLNGVVAISAGASHSMALKSDGTVVCWGNNNKGQSTSPAELGAVTAISGGNEFSLALKAKAP